MRCPSCQQETSSQTQCERCGAPITQSFTALRAVEGETREVTVLCADLKGSTALASRLDPEAYHDILNEVLQKMSEAVHGAGGSVNQFTGDGVMALFGATGGEEDHMRRGLMAALSIQQSLRASLEERNREQKIELGFRVGLHTGKVFLGRIGGDLRTDYTAQGQTTTLAQRMEGLASTGQIFVTEAIFLRARSSFRFLERGEFAIKGQGEPVKAFSLEGILSSQEEPGGASFAGVASGLSSPRSYTPRHLADQILKYRSALEGEHKSVTILFAELMGASQLEGSLSPEERHEILDGALGCMFEAVHSVEGTVNQFTGEGVMALFGAPIAHEDHVQRALLAALSIRERLSIYLAEHAAELGFRVGLNTGKVFVGRIGDDLRMDYTAQGLTTNLAQRMESLASAGQIFVTEAVWRQAGGAFRFLERGRFLVKGLSEPTPVFSLEGKNDAVSRLEAAAAQGLSPFVGRAEELSTFSGLWESVKEGRGQLCYVVGAAGVGKSRLVYEFTRSLPGATVVTVQALSYGSTSLYYPFRLLCRELLEIPAEANADDIPLRVEEALSARGLPPVYAYFLTTLAGGKAEDPRFSQLEAKERQQRTHEAVRDLLWQAAKGPLVVLFEDLHWLDSASEALFAFLVEEMKDAPVLFFGTTRPGFVPPFTESPHITRVSLAELPSQATRELIDCMLAPSRGAPSLYEFLLARTGGNSLFIEELLRTLRNSDGLRETEEGLVLAQENIALPPTLQSLFSARLDRLSEDAKQVALAASVIGLTSPLKLLSRAVEAPDRLGENVSELAQKAVFLVSEAKEEGVLRFINALLQETAYSSLLRPQRQGFHLRIAQAVEDLHPGGLDEQAEVLAYHYQRSATPRLALKHLIKASEQARAISANEAALSRLKEAVGILDALPKTSKNIARRVEILLAKERLYETLGQRENQQQAIQEVFSLLGAGQEDESQRAEALVRQGDLYTQIGRFEEAEKILEEALSLQRQREDGEGESQVLRSLGYLRWNQDRYPEAIRYNEAALAIDRRLNEPTRVANDISNLGTLYRYLGEYAQALSHLQEALEIYETLQNPQKQAFTLYTMAHVLKDLDAPEQAEAQYQKARDIFAENRDQLMASRALSGLANLYLDQGRTEEGLGLYEEVLKITREIKYGQGISHALKTLGEIQLAQNRPREALRFFMESTSVFAALQDQASELQIWKKIAGISEQSLSDPKEAFLAWERVHTLSAKSANPRGSLEALGHLGRLSRKIPDQAKEALSYFEKALELAEVLGDAPALGNLLNTVAILYWGQGDPESALACYRQALRLYREMKDVAKEGLLLNSLGATLRRLGRDEEALVYFTEAVKKNQEAGQKLFLGHGLSALGDIYRDRGEYLKAIFQYHASLTIRKEINDRKGEGWMNYSLAKTYLRQGNQSQAIKFLSLAKEIADECEDKELSRLCTDTREQLSEERDD